MLKIIIAVISAIAAVGTMLILTGDFGYLQLRLAGWQVETTAGAAGILLLASLALVMLVLRILFWPINLGKRLRADKVNQQITVFSDALVKFLNGENAESHETLNRIKSGNMQLPALMLAARAANNRGDFENCQKHLRQARNKFPDQKASIGLIESLCMEQNGQMEPALQCLRSLIESGVQSNSLWRRITSILRSGGRWSALNDLIKQFRITLPGDELEALKAAIGASTLASCPSVSVLEEKWQQLGSKQRKHPVIAAAFCRRGVELMWNGDYFAVIKSALAARWDQTLGSCLPLVPLKDATRVLQWMEGYRHRTGSFYLVLASLAIREELWGIAAEALEKTRKEADGVSALNLSMAMAFLQSRPNSARELLFRHIGKEQPQLAAKYVSSGADKA